MENAMATPRIDPDPLSPLNQMQKYLVHEFVEDFHDGLLSRRDLVAKIGHIAGGAAAAAAILTWFGVSTEEAGAQDVATPQPTDARSPISVTEDDPAVSAIDITFMSGDVSYTAYEARPARGATPMADATPAANGTGALVLVCHENRGLTDHIRDVTRRLAAAGYVGVAVDLLSPEGGTAAIEDQSAIPGILTDGDITRHVVAFQNAITHYETAGEPGAAHPGMIGFCFGGGMTWRTATQEPRLRAGVAFYGPPPPSEDVPNITAAMLGIYSDDPGDFANEGLDELTAALELAGVTHQINVYPGTQHAFSNDTGQRYNEEQALIAWDDTLAWLAQHTGNR
jgi:carboxymethylenebutenolidase